MIARWAGGLILCAAALASAQTSNELDGLRELARQGSIAAAESTATVLLAARHPDSALIWEFLANLHLAEGDLARAQAEAESMHVRYRQSQPPDELRVAASLHLRGTIARRQAEYTQARAFYEESLALRERLLGKVHVDVAWSLNNLANVYYELGDYARTAELHRRALAIREQLLEPEHPDIAFSLNNLANAMMELDQLAEAIPLLERSLAIREKAHGPMHVNVAQSLNNLALAHGRRDEFALADSLYARSVAIREAVLGADHPEVARSLLRRSFVREALGYPDDALAMAERSLQLRQAGLSPEHPEVGLCHLRMAHVLARQGRVRAAAEQARLAEGISRRHFARMARGLEERAAIAYLGERNAGLDLLLELNRNDARLDSLAFDAVIRSRTLVLQEMMTRQRVVAAASDRRTQAIAQALIERRAEVASLALEGPADDSEAEFLAQLAAVEAEAEAAERALAKRSEQLGRLVESSSIGLREVQRCLPANSALVSFARYGTIGEPAVDVRYADERYVAFVLRAGESRPTHVDLGDAAAIDVAAASWLELLRVVPSPLRRAAAEQALRAAGLALRTLLFDPIETRLGTAEQIFLVPDAMLALLPWQALPGRSGAFLVESERAFQMLNSERELAEFSAAQTHGSGLLAVGGVDFQRAQLPCNMGGLAPLPGSRLEVENIAAIWRAGSQEAIELLEGSVATERQLRTHAPGRRVLHLATHGFFVDAACRRDGDFSAAPYRGGIVLSPAPGEPSGDDDGWLTAGEIAGLDLGGVECAVLSACHSGAASPDAAGEELLGLRRALRVAGVATVITSLWEVEDASARAWMTAFYEARWQRRLPIAAAVRLAARQVLEQRRQRGQSEHPSAWANFVAVGDWR